MNDRKELGTHASADIYSRSQVDLGFEREQNIACEEEMKLVIRKEELVKQKKIKEIEEKIADNEKFFEVTKPVKMWKTEYSFGLNDENAKCDIHDVEDIEDGEHRKVEIFSELIKGRVKEETWFCPQHNKMFFDIKDKAKKEIKRLEKRLNKIKYPDRLFI